MSQCLSAMYTVCACTHPQEMACGSPLSLVLSDDGILQPESSRCKRGHRPAPAESEDAFIFAVRRIGKFCFSHLDPTRSLTSSCFLRASASVLFRSSRASATVIEARPSILAWLLRTSRVRTDSSFALRQGNLSRGIRAFAPIAP